VQEPTGRPSGIVKPSILVVGHNQLADCDQNKLTAADFANAHADAKHIAESSSAVAALFNCLVWSRRLYVLFRESLDNTLDADWEVQNIELVRHTLAASAEHVTLNEGDITATRLLEEWRHLIRHTLVAIKRIEQGKYGSESQDRDSQDGDSGASADPVES
jgi:hypothetical protein